MTILRVGQTGFDAYSNNNWTVDAIRANGGSFFTGYICQDNPVTHPKIIAPAKFIELRNAGFTGFLNYEWYAGRPLDGDGALDGVVAAAMAKPRGVVPGEFILCSVDTNAGGFTASGPTRPAELPIVERYLLQFQAELAKDGYRLGVYCGGWLLRWLVDRGTLGKNVLWWQPQFAWSGRVEPETHILQSGQAIVGGVTSDKNYVVKAFDTSGVLPSPGPITPPVPSPPPIDPIPGNTLEVEVPDYICTDPGGNLYSVSPGGVKPITGWEYENVPAYVNAGAPLVPDQATLDRIAVYLHTGRWPLPDGSLVPPPVATAVVDTASIVSGVVAGVTPKIPTTFKAA